MKIHVVGSGPCGCITAIKALERDVEVIVSEEHPISGIPENCSGLISKTGLKSLKEFVNYEKFIENSYTGAIIDFAGEKVEINKKEIVAHKINRSKFDQELASNAEKKGAIINYNEKINGNFYSDVVIGADGPNSLTANYFSFPKIKKFVLSAQTVVPFQSQDPKQVRLFYSNKLFPGFFGWIIPNNKDSAEFGCGCVLPGNPKKGLEYLLKKFETKESKIDYALIPVKSREKTFLKNNGKQIALVGDAAGQTKATTGGGVVFGGNCASVLGENINQLENYEHEWTSNFGFDLKIHSMIQGFLSGRSETELRNFGKLLNSTNVDEFLSKNGHMDKPSKMMNLNLITHFLKNLF